MKSALIALLAFWMCWGVGCSKNLTEFEETKALAEKGNAAAQYNLGDMYREGEGVAEDDKEAVKWYRKAAEQGHAQAQNNLGDMYANGEGVPMDSKEAVKWYRKAAEQGFDIAQTNLGAMYNNGKGVLKDVVTAYTWYTISVANGEVTAKGYKPIIATKMTPDQIAKAEELYIEMVKKNPKLLNK
jgi:hypothetical protein